MTTTRVAFSGRPARPTSCSTPPRSAAGLVVAVLCLVPLGYVVVSVVRPRAAGGPRLPGPAADRRAAVEHHPACSSAGSRSARRSASAARGSSSAPTYPARGWWHAVMCAPLAVPAFVNGYGWVSTTHAVQSYWGAVLVVSLSYYPLVYLPTVAALRRLDPSLEEVSTSLGNGPVATFGRVVLPAISTGGPGRVAAGRASSPRRVRRPAAAQLPDPDHGDPGAVRHRLQRPAGHSAGRGAGGLLPRAARARAAAAPPPRPLPGGTRREPSGRADQPRPTAPACGRRPARTVCAVARSAVGEPGPVADPRILDGGRPR